jgi:hypothetical protein
MDETLHSPLNPLKGNPKRTVPLREFKCAREKILLTKRH